MVDWSLIVAVLVVALLGGAIIGAVSLAIGGMGVTRMLGQRLSEMEATVERTDERITREVKTRAGLTAASKRTDADVRKEAEAHLGEASASSAQRRPSVLRIGQ